MMTVKEWRDAVESRIQRKGELKALRSVEMNPVKAEQFRSEARANNRLLEQNRRHLAIAESIERRAEEKRAGRCMGV